MKVDVVLTAPELAVFVRAAKRYAFELNDSGIEITIGEAARARRRTDEAVSTPVAVNADGGK